MYLEDGQIVHCAYEDKNGEAALFALLGAPEQSAQFNENLPSPQRERFRSCDQILLEAAHLIDQAKAQTKKPARKNAKTVNLTPGAKPPHLLIISEQGITPPYSLEKTETRIGRVSDNDFVIPDSSVSSHHCIIKQVDRRWFLEDKDSTNGTFIDGFRVDQAELQSGAILQFGAIFVKFEIPTETPSRRLTPRQRRADPAVKTAQLNPPPRPGA